MKNSQTYKYVIIIGLLLALNCTYSNIQAQEPVDSLISESVNDSLLEDLNTDAYTEESSIDDTLINNIIEESLKEENINEQKVEESDIEEKPAKAKADTRTKDSSSSDNPYLILLVVLILIFLWIHRGLNSRKCRACGRRFAMQDIDYGDLGISKDGYKSYVKTVKVRRRCKYCGHEDVVKKKEKVN